MSMTDAADRFTALPGPEDLAATVVALEEHGFSVEVVDGLDDARTAVLARIPAGSSVMTNTSVTLQETGIADAINDDGRYAWGAANVAFVVGAQKIVPDLAAAHQRIYQHSLVRRPLGC